MSVFAVTPARGQVSLSTGGISGTVTDPQGAAVPAAKITISNKELGTNQALQSSSAGYFTIGALSPGNYTVRVEAPNFKSYQTTVAVQVGQMATANARLELGTPSTLVEVTTTNLTVNSEQATVQDVLTAQDIEQLPVNGRNFLDLATLEPGVQIQDGSTFDPTKNGYSSLSFGGRYGRTARIEVDGVDISDETVGTTTQNIPQSAIEEFQVASSSLDMSTELTSSGTVNVVTRSGKNEWHGASVLLRPQQSNFGQDRRHTRHGTEPADLPFGENNLAETLAGRFCQEQAVLLPGFRANRPEPAKPGDTSALATRSSNFLAAIIRHLLSGNTWRAWITTSGTIGQRFSGSTMTRTPACAVSTRACISHLQTSITCRRMWPGTDFQIGKTTN